MSDVQLLLLVLAAIYSWECACWLPRGAVGFATWFGNKWRLVHPASLLGNQRGGFVLAAPFPPLGTLLAGNQFPLSISSTAVFSFVASSVNPGWRPAQSQKLVSFQECHSIEALGKKVRINNAVFLSVSSPTMARFLSRELQTLLKLPPGKRGDSFRQMVQHSLDTKAIQNRWGQFGLHAKWLSWLTNSLFAFLFVFAPVFLWNFGLAHFWLPLLLVMLALTTSIAALFRRAHKALYPDAAEERFTHFLTILLSPATAVRARDVLSRPLLEEFHPLAIAKVFCRPQQFRAFAERILRELRYPGLPQCPLPDPAAQEAERFSRNLLLEQVEALLQSSGISPADLLKAPVQADASSLAYCPRCLAQFSSANSGACADCGGIELIALEPQKAKVN